jgi:hypothetical protein
MEDGMLRRALLLFVIAFLAIPVRASAQTWTEYRPAGVGFSLEMPGQWTADVKDIDTAIGLVKGYMASIEMEGRAYLSMYIPYPPDRVRGKPVQPILDGARDGAVSNVHGHLRSEEQVTVGNFAGRQLVIDAPNDLVLVHKFFMMDAILVQAVVVGHPGVEKDPSTLHFLQSLKLVSP